jgi:hypothetical protein
MATSKLDGGSTSPEAIVARRPRLARKVSSQPQYPTDASVPKAHWLAKHHGAGTGDHRDARRTTGITLLQPFGECHGSVLPLEPGKAFRTQTDRRDYRPHLRFSIRMEPNAVAAPDVLPLR